MPQNAAQHARDIAKENSAPIGEFVSVTAPRFEMMEPTQELLDMLPELAKKYWTKRLEHITTERRRLSNRLAEVKTLNQRVLLQKVNGELSAEDFAMLKESVAQQKADVEAQLNVLDAETTTMQGLLEETKHNIVDLVKAWRNGTVQQRQEPRTGVKPLSRRFDLQS